MTRCERCHRRRVGGARCPHDGWTPGPEAAETVEAAAPPRVAGYTVAEPIGAGGFAVVWAASREADGAAATIKVGRSGAPALAERFRREADAMRRVGAPHAPAIFEHGEADGVPYIAMERLFGETLAAALAALPGPPELGWIAEIAGALLSALEAAHARGVIHRDLKPENVFLVRGGRVVLLDFGLVKRAEPEAPALTRSGVAVGTLEYMAPEQLRGERGVDARADLYAFGVILYELLTLRPPFAGDPSAIELGHLALRPPRPSALAPVPEPLEALVLACLAKDPARRPAGAAAIRRALAEAVTGPPSGRVAPEAPPSARGARLIAEGRHPVAIAVIDTSGDAGAIVAAVAGRGGFLPRQRGRRYVAVFTAHGAENPARAALAAGREIVARAGARVALHLADVTLRPRERGAPTVYGAPVDRPEGWLPAEPWSGLRVTEAMERVLAAIEPAPDAPGAPEAEPGDAARGASVDPLASTEEAPASRPRASPGEEPGRAGEPPLIGREDAVAALAAALARAFEQGTPALSTVLGDPGLGKSRLAVEAAALARRARPDALVIALRAQAHAAGNAPGLGAALLEALGADGAADTGAAGPRRMRALAEALGRRARAGPTAVVLDDAHWADVEVLDALEYATLDGDGAPLWVVITADPRFERARAGWGARTRWHHRAALEPLPQPAAARLAAELLRPAEYPPAAVLERLARWSGGNPFSLAEIVRTLKRAGIVRRRTSTSGYYIATADLDALPPSPAWQWIAARRLGALPPELASCARLCAVLGLATSVDELARVADAIERAGGAGTPIDAGVGLRALADEGLLERAAAEQYAFRNALVQDAIYEAIEPAQRAEIHGHALAYWRARAAAGAAPDAPPEVLEALARHAAAVGAREEAADAHLRLGDLAIAAHRHVEADQRYTAALAAAPEGDARRRMRALGGRGKSRVHVERVREAIEDLVEARGLAAEVGDRALLAELLLEEATALDWARDFESSAQRVDEARPLVEDSGSERLQARRIVADGRTAWRREQVAASIELLEQGLALAVAQGDHDARVLALVMLAWQLVCMGRLDESEGRFQEAIAVTEEAGDRAHLCVAYVNRGRLWVARKEPARAACDLSRAVTIAREMGSSVFERTALYNVAELLHWSGRQAEALPLARRACLLEDRFLDRPIALGRLLLARILLEMGAFAQAGRLVDEVAALDPSDLREGSEIMLSVNTSFRMVRLVLVGMGAGEGAATQGGWDEPVELAERGLGAGILAVDDLLEVLCWRARVALRGGRAQEVADTLRRARPWLDEAPGWRRRFDELLFEDAPGRA